MRGAGWCLGCVGVAGALLVGCGSSDEGSPLMAGTGGASDSGGAPAGGGVAAGGAAGSAAGGMSNGGAGGVSNGGAGGVSSGGGGQGGGAGGAAGHVFSIRFDYRYDTAMWFTPERRAALDAAAAAWSAVIADDFPSVPAGTSIRLRDPENRDQYVWAENLAEPIDDVLVFVGTTVDAIAGDGRGGPSGTADSPDQSLLAALAERRDGARFQPWAGSITFKKHADKPDYYYFDSTPETASDIPQPEFDFISLASHELGHVLGFTYAPAVTAHVSGLSFVGTSAVAEFGAPVPLNPDTTGTAWDLGHIADGTMSHGQEALMSPRLTNGLRLVPTPLDLAILEDVGYTLKR